MTTIIVNSFVKRQVPGSRFTHFEGTWDKLAQITFQAITEAREGYREGVLLVDVDPRLFRSGLVTLKPGDRLVGQFEARQDGEAPRKSTSVVGAKKSQAKSAFVVLYHSSVLAEDNSNEGDAEDLDSWEIISINASPDEEPPPIDPNTLCHNHFGSDGGTATNMTDQEFVAQMRISFDYWKDKGFVEGE